MDRNVLVIIPSLMVKYSFSAPLAWLFSGRENQVRGIYSFEVGEAIVKEYDFFVIELMWFIQLHEFILLTRFIKKHNPSAKILFGGLFSQLKYADLFEIADVDYFIKGDNEEPIRRFLDGQDPRLIPNFVGRGFENKIGYLFSAEEYSGLEFGLEWFPSYLEYWHATTDEDPNKSYDFPFPPHGRYHLPVLITARGGCPAQHEGCESCIARQPGLMKGLYGRPPVRMGNDTIISLLKKIEQKFQQASIIQINNQHYDFTGEKFDLDCTIEIDWLASIASVHKMLPAFRKSHWHLSLYSQGLADNKKRTISEIRRFIEMEDENHRIQFWGAKRDLMEMEIPGKNCLYFGDFFPETYHYRHYSKLDNALLTSKRWYMFTRQMNLYSEGERHEHMSEASSWLERMKDAVRSGTVDQEDFLSVP